MIVLEIEPIEVDVGIELAPIENELELEIGEIVTQGGDAFPWYEGDYEVEPDFVKQTLPTKNRSMAEDVLILEIPTHEVTNDYGTTYIVGGI